MPIADCRLPTADCSDREQRELSPNGLTRRKIEPTYSAREMAEREDRAREAAVQAARLTDERRRERALLVRYPSAASHDRERNEALVQIDAVIQAAQKRIAELGEDRKKIDEDLSSTRRTRARRRAPRGASSTTTRRAWRCRTASLPNRKKRRSA